MSWKMLGKPTTCIADHSLVERYKTMEPCHGDRALRESRLRRLAAALADGTFRTCSWASVHCLADGKTYRINGKHTSHAMAEMNGTLPKVFVTEERYEAETLEDVAELYATFDSQTSTRTGRDITKAFAGTDLTLNEIPDKTLNLCASGISAALAATGEAKDRITAEARARHMLRHKNFVQWFEECIGQRRSSNAWLHRQSVVAAMFNCYRVDKQQAAIFWSAVLNGTDPIPDAPSRTLQNYLRESKVTVSKIDYEMYAKCGHAWNASRRGVKHLKRLAYYPESALPEFK